MVRSGSAEPRQNETPAKKKDQSVRQVLRLNGLRLTLILSAGERGKAWEVTNSEDSCDLDESISHSRSTDPTHGYPSISACGSRRGQAKEINRGNLPEEGGDLPKTNKLAGNGDSAIIYPLSCCVVNQKEPVR